MAAQEKKSFLRKVSTIILGAILAIIFLLPLMIRLLDEKSISPPPQGPSTPVSSITKEKETVAKNNIDLDERQILQNSYFGDFRKGKKIKQSDKIRLEV